MLVKVTVDFYIPTLEKGYAKRIVEMELSGHPYFKGKHIVSDNTTIVSEEWSET